MASKSLFESNPILTLGAIVILAVAADAVAARRGGGGGEHGSGGGYYGVGLGSGGSAFRSGAPVRSGALTAHPDTAVRSGQGNGQGGQVNAPVNAQGNAQGNVPENVHRGVALHRQVARHRVVHGGIRVDWYDGCYRRRRVVTPFGWTLRRVNICAGYDGQYDD
jgi:hypothetical protein